MTPSKEPVRVTDHAVLRYLERALEFDIDAVRSHIAKICAGPAAFGATSLRADGVRFEFAGNAVVTVIKDQAAPTATTRARAQHKLRASV